MSRRRLMKLMQELVSEGRAELSDEYPFRFLGVAPDSVASSPDAHKTTRPKGAL